jgi:hypothetical protein
MLKLLSKEKEPLVLIFIFSFSLIASKWLISYYLYSEDVLTKIIWESTLSGDGAYYIPFIKYLSEFNFSNSFDPFISNLKNLTIPYGTILIPSILFKLFSFYGLIINEFIAVFIFLIIFFKIFNFYFSKEISIFFSLLLFTIPVFLNFFQLEGVDYFTVLKSDIFTLRLHRPVYSHIILYCFIYVIFLINNFNAFTKKYFLLLGLLAGLSFVGFYYHFVIEFIFLFIYLIYKFQKKIFNFLYKNLSIFLYFIFSFLIISLPFIFNIYYAEEDYLTRNAAFSLTNFKKIYLIKYYLGKYVSIKFLSILLLSVSIFYFFIRKRNKYTDLIVIFFIFFLSSITAPIIFFIFSSKSGLMYHFNNAVVVFYFLFIYSFIIITVNTLYSFFKKKYLIYFLIYFLILINLINFYKSQILQYRNYKERTARIEFNEVVKKIKEIKLVDKKFNQFSFLTFDSHIMIWLILNDVKYLNVTNQLFSPKTDNMIEDSLIKNFKFLGLEKSHFNIFLENRKEGWRIINYNVADFFRFKYTANSLNTFNASRNFNNDFAEFIFKSSPLYSQQMAIPEEEFVRLEKKFKDIKLLTNNYLQPNFIILHKNHYVYKNMRKDFNKKFCVIYEGDFYIFYSNLKEILLCIN